MIKKIFYLICWGFETACYLTHPFLRMEEKLTGRFCNLTLFSCWLDNKFNVGYWDNDARY